MTAPARCRALYLTHPMRGRTIRVSRRHPSPMTTAARPSIARLDELVEGQPLAREVETAEGPRRLVVLRAGGEPRVYLNSCPHQGVRLDWQPGVLLDVAGEHLQCSMHGALFRLEDGYCLFGPCAGRALLAVEFEAVDGELRLASGARVPPGAR